MSRSLSIVFGILVLGASKVPSQQPRLELAPCTPPGVDASAQAKCGTLTVYEGDDPTCTAMSFPAGTGAVEAGSSSHLHFVRNETNSVAEAVVTYMVPVGTTQAQLRSDRGNPGNCSF